MGSANVKPSELINSLWMKKSSRFRAILRGLVQASAKLTTNHWTGVMSNSSLQLPRLAPTVQIAN